MSLSDADVHLPDSVRAGIDNFLAASDGSIASPISGDSDQHNNAQIPDVSWRTMTDGELLLLDSLPSPPDFPLFSGQHHKAALIRANIPFPERHVSAPIGLRQFGPELAPDFYHDMPDLLDEADDLPVLLDMLDTPSAPLDICLVDDIIWAKFAVLFMQYEDQSLPDLNEVDNMPVSLWVFDLPVTSSDNDIPDLVDIEDDVTVIFYDPSVDHEIVHGVPGA